MKQFFSFGVFALLSGSLFPKGCLEEQLGLRCLEDSEPFP